MEIDLVPGSSLAFPRVDHAPQGQIGDAHIEADHQKVDQDFTPGQIEDKLGDAKNRHQEQGGMPELFFLLGGQDQFQGQKEESSSDPGQFRYIEDLGRTVKQEKVEGPVEAAQHKGAQI